MFKQLKIYYVLVSMPFAALLLGSVFFFEPIKRTITTNPHPQINYAIFAIVLTGGTFVIVNAHRLVREARTLLEFTGAIRSKTDPAVLQEMANGFSGDISCLLQMVAATGGRAISHQEQAAIEHEVNNARSRLTRRNALPQYLSGLLVGMGLLGTFIGLLATLNDISILISSFADLDMSNASPILIFRTMIERMKAPMQSMGIAFSASMFGLLGSITLGLMMVGIRRIQGDIMSILSSETARRIEISLGYTPPQAASAPAAGGVMDSKVLVRIEERLTEVLRVQQRILAAEVDDFKTQRAEMLRALTDRAEADKSLRSELQLMGQQLGSMFGSLERSNGELSAQLSELTVQLASDAKDSRKLPAVVEKGNGEIVSQLSELTSHMASDARESRKLLALQVDEQKKLLSSLESYKIDERLAEAARLQQRALSSDLDEFRTQRADLLRILVEQSEASSSFRSELQQLGMQAGSLFGSLENGNDELCNRISELMVHMTADAKESQKLLTILVNEQMRLRDSLDLRIKGKKTEQDSFLVAGN